MVFTQFVQAGRAIVITKGKYRGCLAFVADIIDINTSIVDGPTTGVPRMVLKHTDMDLTDFLLEGVPRGIQTEELKAAIEESNIVDEWNKTNAAIALRSEKARESLTDFEKYIVRHLKAEKYSLIQNALNAQKS